MIADHKMGHEATARSSTAVRNAGSQGYVYNCRKGCVPRRLGRHASRASVSD